MTKVVIDRTLDGPISVTRDEGIGSQSFSIQGGGGEINFDREEAYEIVNALRFLAAPYKRWEME
jgi:hypothetical protein